MFGYGILSVVIALLVVYCRHQKQTARTAVDGVSRALADRDVMAQFLDRFSRTMVASRNESQWMQSMAMHLASAIGARCLRVFLIEQQNHLVLVASHGELPAARSGHGSKSDEVNAIVRTLSRDQLEIDEGFFAEVIRTKTPLHQNFPQHTLGNGGTDWLDSVIAMPMSIDEQPTGVICAVNKEGTGVRFDLDDLNLLASLSNDIALGASLFQIYKDLGDQHRIQQELRLACEIQDSLLPTKMPDFGWFRGYGANRSAKEVGGDLFDFIQVDEDHLMVLIADASGKGVPACMVISMCRIVVRANAARYKDNLEGLLQEVNRNLYRDTDLARFVTLACCLIDLRDFTVEYARAGHTELLIRDASNQVQVISPDGPALGLLPPDDDLVDFDTLAFSWLPKTSIMLFTDGVTEALNEYDEEYGLDRLIETFKNQNSDPQSASANVLASVREFSESQPQTDDQTIVILSRID